MIKKNAFYIIVIIIYLLVLSKDYIFGGVNNFTKFPDKVCKSADNYYKNEYEKLAKGFDIPTNNYKIEYTKIAKRDIYEFYDVITILKGSKDGLRENDIVINELGLVGIIKKVNKNYSEVYLLTNNKINLSVKIGNSYGILSSKDNKIVVKNIKLDGEIKKGDKVYTSGLTDTPDSILIGEVREVFKDDLELEYILEVEPVVNFNRLDILGVIIN